MADDDTIICFIDSNTIVILGRVYAMCSIIQRQRLRKEQMMKAKVNLDNRIDVDKMWDNMYNKMVRSANLSARQSMIVSKYLRDIIGLRMHEIEAAMEMSYLLALIEGEKFGTDGNRGATRLIRVQQNAVDIRNKAYGYECIDANGRLTYDGCGLQHMKKWLERYGIEYDANLDE